MAMPLTFVVAAVAIPPTAGRVGAIMAAGAGVALRPTARIPSLSTTIPTATTIMAAGATCPAAMTAISRSLTAVMTTTVVAAATAATSPIATATILCVGNADLPVAE